jgi:hypothetical protein
MFLDLYPLVQTLGGIIGQDGHSGLDENWATIDL